MKRFRTLIVVSLVVALAAILIMPQVDLPDAVVNSARVRIASFSHVGAGSSLTAKILPSVSSLIVSSLGSKIGREVTDYRYINVHSVLIQLHTLRC